MKRLVSLAVALVALAYAAGCQCGVNDAVPPGGGFGAGGASGLGSQIVYPYYTTKGPDDFFVP